MSTDDPLEGLRAELEETFREELSERLHEMEGAVLELERESSPEMRQAALERLARDAHSLKGGAQLLGHEVVARIAHALEDRLASARGAPTSAPPLESLFVALGALRVAARDESAVDLPRVLDQLSAEPATRAGTGAKRQPRQTGAGQHERRRTPRDARAHTMRVSTERVDRLLARAGELVVARNRLRRRWSALQSAAEELQDAMRQWPDEGTMPAEAGGQTRAAPSVEPQLRLVDPLPADVGARTPRFSRLIADGNREAQELDLLLETVERELLALRVVPMELLFSQFRGMVRDLSRHLGKEVEFEAEGWETPLDRELLERVGDPLMHLLRNAVHHGIETPDERGRAGKPRKGRIVLRASPRAGGVLVEVSDDGRGIDPEGVRRAARRMGIENAESRAINELIFEPGLSTASEVSTVSGRGVGLDVVRAQVGGLGGTVEVSSDGGAGLSFALRLPFTLVATKVLLVRIGSRRYALPLNAVERVVSSSAADGRRLGQRLTVEIEGERIVTAALADVLNGSGGSVQQDARFLVLLASLGGRAALLVDAIEGEREVIARGLGSLIAGHPLLSGAAVVDDDLLVPMLDHAAVIEGALHSSSHQPERQEDSSRAPIQVLVVDDSITTRTLERNVLLAAGFSVDMAIDGRDALRQIRQRRPDVVVTDIDMPRMDGLELLRAVRDDPSLAGLPMILVTSLERPEQRELGLELGADAYLPKSTFDERVLVEQIRELAS